MSETITRPWETDLSNLSKQAIQFRRQLLTPPAIKEISVVEKKYVEKGKGCILETR
ncbi:hypothetical protein ACTID9_08280 [Brevibacillus fluminis]|uniref:hypothetical protein n=1 Tax=Brevibacillus fluminis TaxID=511487 RepID=UPI003F8B7643